jgi:8-oxo-dGTP pyrophosphatase MutT (NUDIX family)
MTNTRSEAIRPAASIVLVRDAEAGLEVYMLERHQGQGVAFAGALVFPGGKVDTADADPRWGSLAPGVPSEPERRFWIAAVRETFEESGLLLARRDGADTFVDAPTAHRIVAEARRGGGIDFAGVLRRERLHLAVDRMLHFGHWITPPWQAKRFDTHFFLTVAPVDQIEAFDGTESAEGFWIRPQAALDELAAGKRTMVAVTRLTLELLASWRTAEQAVAKAVGRRIVTVIPTMERTATGQILRIPREAGYLTSEIVMERA